MISKLLKSSDGGQQKLGAAIPIMLAIIHNLGGCGGTLLSRCIGVLPRVALLSEMNPAAVNFFPHFNPLHQDENWLHLLRPADRRRFSEMNLEDVDAFRELMQVFYVRAAEAGRHLVLRDYTFIDFVGLPYTSEPPRHFMLHAALPANVPRRAVAFIRHPIDQWFSLCKHEHVRAVLSPSDFCEAYAAFLEELQDIRRFRYEDFVESPASELRAICGVLGLPFDPSFAERFHAFDNVTGDFTRHHERSISLPGPRRLPPEVLGEFRSNSAFHRILHATGYGKQNVREPLSLEKAVWARPKQVEAETAS